MSEKLQGLAAARLIYSDRTKRVRELKAEGHRIMGYVCLYPPLEMMTALGFVPYRIFGRYGEPVSAADTVFTPVVCHFLRSMVDQGMKGNYSFLDGIIGSHTCDIGSVAVHIWKDYIPEPNFVYFIDVPHTDHLPAQEYFKSQILDLKRKMEEFAGQEITDSMLAEAISLHNRQRQLVRELYELRKADPSPLSGTENLEVMVASCSLPVKEGNELLQQVIEEVKERSRDRLDDRARVMVWGTVLDNSALLQVIEESGATVVIDDTCIGTRAYWDDIPLNGDPWDALTRRYLVDLKCPRTYRQASYGQLKRDYDADLDSRFGYLKNMAQDWKAQGVILQSLKYCDSHGYDVPGIRHYLDTLGIPSIYIEHDYTEGSLAPIRTRIEAFVETIKV
ncbi:MAG: 2-hydroxyacyl-CoA dehydratase subunit D [Bacillota bacterium]